MSATSYKFEHWAIEFSIGFGHSGSDPRHIKCYLSQDGFDCSRRTSGFYGLDDSDSERAFRIIAIGQITAGQNGVG